MPAPTQHFMTNAAVIERFLSVKIGVEQKERGLYEAQVENC
jgi:RNA 3'-terminal phosphate cyclase